MHTPAAATSASMNTTTNTTSTIEKSSSDHVLPRVPSSPVIEVANSSEEAVPSSDLSLEDEDAFATLTSSNIQRSAAARPPIMASYYQRPTRRERSLSSITSPRNPHQRSSSAAILDLEYSSPDAAMATKRRSLSTCGPSPMPLPTSLEAGSESWSPPEKLCKPPPKSRTMPPVTGGHVRFEDNKPYKCHHLLSEESHWTQQAVQRTQSNPEMMELCPVCLARKECEILLKRTYSKVL